MTDAQRDSEAKASLPRLHVLSDLHLETGLSHLEGYTPPDCDIVVAAGDIHADPREAIMWLAALGKPVVYVLGNHEFWRVPDPSPVPPLPDFVDTIAAAREAAQGTDVHVLENDAIVLSRVRFLGTTLWADFGQGRLYNAVESRYGGWRLRNYAAIGAASFYRDPVNKKVVEAIQRDNPDSVEREAFHPRIAHTLHERAVKFLNKALSEDFNGPTVVVTHMAPHYDSLVRAGLNARFLERGHWVEPERDAPLHRVAEYASDLTGLLRWNACHIDLWVHGHIHAPLDYAVCGVRVVCNPAGYQSWPVVGFRADMLVQPEDGLVDCLRSDLEPILEELDAIRLEAGQVSRVLSDTQTVTQRCVQVVFRQLCRRFTDIAFDSFARASSQLGDRCGRGAWNFPRLISGEAVQLPNPQLPLDGLNVSDSSNTFSAKASGREALAQMSAAIDSLSAYPTAVERTRLLVQARVSAVVEAIHAAGGTVVVTGPITRSSWHCLPRMLHATLHVKGVPPDKRNEWVIRADNIANPDGLPREVLIEFRFDD